MTTTYERNIKLLDRPLIPREIIESDKSLQAYLEENVIQNRQDEKIRLRIARTKNTWINKRLEAAAKKIWVEPLKPVQLQKLSKPWNKYNNNEGQPAAAPEIKRVDICKQEPTRGESSSSETCWNCCSL